MKKLLALVLALVMVLSMVACAKEEAPAAAPAPAAPAATEEKAEEAAPAEAVEEAVAYDKIFKKPFEAICSWAAGGGADTNNRTIAAVVTELTGQNVTATNQTGGSGAVGFAAIMNGNTSGYTYGIITAELNTLPPQGLVDFTYEDMYPLIRICTLPSVVAVRADSPFNTLEELVAYAKEHPGELKVGTVGTGSIWHICAAKLMKFAGIELTTVPYDGAASAATAMLAGEIDLTTTELAVSHAYVQSGDMKILGIMSEERIEGFDYPTCIEQGYECVGGSFQGFCCPNGVSDEMKANLEALLTEAYNSDAYQEFCATAGMVPSYLDHEGWEAFLAEDLELVTELMKDMGLAN